MDKTLVYPEAGPPAHLQIAQSQELTLGRHGAVDDVSSDWTAKQEGRFLF